MPTLTKKEQATKQLNDEVLRNLATSTMGRPFTRSEVNCTRHRIRVLLDEKLIKHSGEAKIPGSAGRKAVTYELTAKGVKRAEKL